MVNILEKNEAMKLIQKSAREYLKLKVKIPLGNPALKKVHTNQFCFLDMPAVFQLDNWETIAQIFQSITTRFNGYTLGRWYIEAVTTDVDANGKMEMELTLNAFPSATDSFTSSYRKFQDTYNNAVNKSSNNSSSSNNNSNSSNSSSSNNNNTTVKSNNYFPSKAGKNVSSNISTAAKQITEGCNTEEQRAYCIYDWVDRYVVYRYYSGYLHPSSWVLTNKLANCWDTAFLIYNLCTACKPKVRCEIYNGNYHFLDYSGGHLWNKLPYKGKMVFADTGRSNRNPIGSHGGSGRYIISGGSSPYRKNY